LHHHLLSLGCAAVGISAARSMSDTGSSAARSNLERRVDTNAVGGEA
jgi:hypothetical protein